MSTQRLTRSSCRRILADKNGQQKVNLLTKKKKKATRSMMIKTPAILQPKSLSLDDIRRRLHPSVMPARLPCRDAQFENICNFIESTIRDCTSSSIYISGVPGTGKTATVMQVYSVICIYSQIHRQSTICKQTK
jgi:origin recognition complex subunit 1